MEVDIGFEPWIAYQGRRWPYDLALRARNALGMILDGN
jgi:hypothetical protein